MAEVRREIRNKQDNTGEVGSGWIRGSYVHHANEFEFILKEEEPIEGLTERVEMTGFIWYKNISCPYG